jgi:hypothetical protein
MRAAAWEKSEFLWRTSALALAPASLLNTLEGLQLKRVGLLYDVAYLTLQNFAMAAVVQRPASVRA